MTYDCTLNWLRQVFITLSVVFASTLWAGMPVHYASPMGEEKWQMNGNPLRCELSLTIPNYGIGYFEQRATKKSHFILRRWDDAQTQTTVQISAISPVWKPQGRTYPIIKTFIKPGPYAIFLSTSPTLQLLTYLSQGYQANFNYNSELGFKITLSLSPIHFQKVYAQYQRCISQLLPFDYERVKESVFHFGVEDRELTQEDKEQLRRIARFVEADPQIEKIRVFGYTDDRGRKGYNNAISQLRAQAVKDYLIELGVPQEKLYVTWWGELKPIGRNDTEAGRAENRRVVVNLIKK